MLFYFITKNKYSILSDILVHLSQFTPENIKIIYDFWIVFLTYDQNVSKINVLMYVLVLKIMKCCTVSENATVYINFIILVFLQVSEKSTTKFQLVVRQ